MLFRRLNKYIHSVYDAGRLNDLNNKRPQPELLVNHLHGIPVERQK